MSATYVRCLTPPGRGAIAVIEVRGAQAWTMTRRLFRAAKARPLPDIPEARATWFGRMGPGAGDEVIVAAPSIEPERLIEVHCHGGPQVVRMLLDLFEQEGCESPAVTDPENLQTLLSRAKTLRTAGILLDQANGAFDRAVAGVRQAIARNDCLVAQAALDELTRLESLGRHLLEPWKIVIAGTPNAGKSSLLNALAGYQRSVVAPIPGTTRDVVTTTLSFDGWLVELADTAGLRDAGDDLEREGIDRALRQIQQADLCLWVLDTTASFPALIQPLTAQIIPVLNKTDLPAAWDVSRIASGVPVSAATGEGIERLIQRIVSVLVPEAPAPGGAVPYSDECGALLGILQNEIHRVASDGENQAAI